MTHRAVEELIPWYANGTLHEAEMAAVSAHLHSCPACAAETERAISESRLFHDDGPRLRTLLGTRRRNLDMLLDGLPTQSAPRRARRHRRAAAVATLALAMLLPVIAHFDSAPSGETTFETQTSRMTPGAGATLQVIFRPDTPEGIVRALIRESGAELLGNPTPLGVYRLAVAEERANEVLRQLRASPAVRWAELER